ncbi:SDR family oxidoreductase [Candidatus Dojkabacteria bacterium]|uniref:SDR family oxidoreductase n=1 Tax=Candidatus Dojkabacteria bacterium TaxID=2099670 RepID=A0A955L646_9BACT|nr:SDR family oxidoreductase [Candidatus Dojkabacteria bacterium]
MRLEDKKVLITGSSAGIGKEIALKLATESTNLLLLGRNQDKLDQVRKESIANGANSANVYAFDLADTEIATSYLESIRVEHPDISVVINNAGIWQRVDDVDKFSHEEIEKIINTNLTALIKVTNTLLPVLRLQNEAAIINVSSKSGVVAQKGQSIYSASKYGVKGFTDVLKADLKGSNIRVAGVYQSGTNTEMFSKAGDNDFPVQNFTDPTDLADVIVYMLSRPEKIWLNEIHVNY